MKSPLKTPSRIVALLGLGVLSLLSSSARAESDSITLHVIRAPRLDWSSPRSLARDTLGNSLARYPIGHVAVELNCGGNSVYSGMHPQSMGEMAGSIFGQRQGMGVLFHSFRGEMENEPKLRKYMETKSERNSKRYAAIRLEVSKEACARMTEYHRTLVENGLDRWYGFPSRPEFGEGGGCSAWVMGYLSAGGLREDWMIQKWARFVRVPRESVGGPLTGQEVKIGKLVFKGAKRWAEENEPHFPLFAYDPDLMYSWAKENAPVTKKRTAPRVTLDLSSLQPGDGPLLMATDSDPREVIADPSLLETRWAEEIEIWKAGQNVLP